MTLASPPLRPHIPSSHSKPLIATENRILRFLFYSAVGGGCCCTNSVGEREGKRCRGARKRRPRAKSIPQTSLTHREEKSAARCARALPPATQRDRLGIGRVAAARALRPLKLGHRYVLCCHKRCLCFLCIAFFCARLLFSVQNCNAVCPHKLLVRRPPRSKQPPSPPLCPGGQREEKEGCARVGGRVALSIYICASYA